MPLPTSEDEQWMQRCLELARAAAANDEVPVGAIVVAEGVVVGEGENRVEALRSPLAHAEMVALQAALQTVGLKRLPGAVLYCTLEPCCMCAGAILHSRLRRVVLVRAIPSLARCGRWPSCSTIRV